MSQAARSEEEVIRLTAKMYEARDAARFVFGDRYRSLIDELSADARDRAAKDGIEFTLACVRLAHESTDVRHQLLLIATAVEHSEREEPA